MLLLASTAHLGYECMDGWMDRTVYMIMWHTAAVYNNTHSHIVNTETRKNNYALADDRTLVSATPVNESNLGDEDLLYNI